MMDTSDDLTYLNYLETKNDTFLLQSADEALGVADPTLNSQTIFGELDDGARIWTIDSLPVFLNGSVISEDQTEESEIKLQLEHNDESLDTCIGNNRNLSYPVEIPSEGFITSNGLFLTNEVLLQVNTENEVRSPTKEADNVHVDNNDTEIFLNGDNNIYKINSKLSETYFHADMSDGNKHEKIININDGVDVIQLLNTDGTIINIDKNILINGTTNTVQENDKVDINEHFERITAYKCKKCNYLSETVADISKHTNNKLCEKKGLDTVMTIPKTKHKAKSLLDVNDIKNKQLVLLCSECNEGYPTTEQLKKHMIQVHQFTRGQNKIKEAKSRNQSKEPREDSRKKEYLSIIKTQQKASRKVKCSIKGCDMRFALDDYRIRHEQCHVDSQKKQFRCPVCDKLFSIWRVCSLHLWKCHEINVGLLTCVVCNYKTFSPQKLWIHMLIHDERKQYLCSECGKSFKQLAQLHNHKALHLAHGEGAPNWVLQQRCDTCGNIFCDTKSLKKHIQSVHNKFKPYVCNICGHKTARKAMLELHLRQHTGEKPYACNLCPYKTGDHNSLRRHMMRHSGGRKYSCRHCNYQSIQSVAYRHHILTRHPGEEDVFQCTHCSFKTVNENVYRTHRNQHENNLIIGTKEQEKSKPEESRSHSEETASIKTATGQNKSSKVEDDEETQHGFLSTINTDETVDTGGITIPAGSELQV